MNTLTITDSRINRDSNFGKYMELSNELIKTSTGYDKEVSGGRMTWDYYQATAYKKTHFDDVQVNIFLDFNTNTATITYEDPISKPEWMNF